MSAEHCELCGRELEAGGFYVVRIEVFADPKMPPVSGKALQGMDFDAEMDRLLQQMKGMSADELQDQVHRRFEYKICPGCQPGVLGNPLGKPRSIKVGEN
jgi:hypothetical protein